MPATAPAETADPAAIEAEIEDLETRRDRLTEKREAVEADLDDARGALQNAESEEAQDEALDKAERLQLQVDTLTEAITDVETDIEVLRHRLSDARSARRREDELTELAELGREAMEARKDYDAVRAEIIEVLREKAPELADRFSAWLTAAEDFRTALLSEERHALNRPSSTTKADRKRAEGLISELKERGVTRLKDALAPHHTSVPAQRWMGWSHENGYDGPGGGLKSAVESIRKFGNQSIHQDE